MFLPPDQRLRDNAFGQLGLERRNARSFIAQNAMHTLTVQALLPEAC